MNISKLPVIAAIPNYNMAASLAVLLEQVISQGYDYIYVLDDNSTDMSRQVVARFAPKIQWVAGETNAGAGANRNRILAAHTENCIIHFLDADVKLESSGVPAMARRMMGQPGTAFVGGQVNDPDGRQSIWNYGPNSVALYSLITASVQAVFGNIQARRPLWRYTIRVLTRPARNDWPDPATPPRRRAVYWPVEGNLLVLRDTLAMLGGFDADVREYDIIPPARKAYELGLVSYFDPNIVVTHLKVNVRHYNRSAALLKELYWLIKRYGGWRKWVLPDGHFKPRYNL